MLINYSRASDEDAAKGVKDSYELRNDVLNSVPEPLVSVYVTTYQHNDFIEKCVDSILTQKTDFTFEIIIGEDFSTDGTREIVFGYAKKYSDKIRVITADYNIKQVANRVRCLKAARGKYIAQCDGDDYWTDPDKLQIQAEFMENNPEFSLCYHSHCFKNNGSLSEKYPFHKSDFTGDQLIGFPHGIAVSTKFYRNLFKNLDDEWLYRFSGDAFCTAFLGTFGKCKFIDKIGPSIYRIHDRSEWNSKDSTTHYHLGRLVRMRLYKRFLEVGDERSAMIALAALRKLLISDRKLVGKEKKLVTMNVRQFTLWYEGMWLQFYYFPIARKIRKIIRSLTGK